MFFDNYKPFYTTVVVNPDINVDKIFYIYLMYIFSDKEYEVFFV